MLFKTYTTIKYVQCLELKSNICNTMETCIKRKGIGIVQIKLWFPISQSNNWEHCCKSISNFLCEESRFIYVQFIVKSCKKIKTIQL